MIASFNFIGVFIAVLNLLVCSTLDADIVYDSDPNLVFMTLTDYTISHDNLELKWVVKNDTGHDIWLCDSLNLGTNPVFEKFIECDNETLIIRKRTDVSMRNLEFPPWISQYIRLRNGESKIETFKIALPLATTKRSRGEQGSAKYAKRIKCEVSYYDEDLPEIILNVVEIDKKLSSIPNADTWDFIRSINSDVLSKYYAGWIIAYEFEKSPGFRESIKAGAEGADSIILPYMSNALKGGKVLQISLDSIIVPIDN